MKEFFEKLKSTGKKKQNKMQIHTKPKWIICLKTKQSGCKVIESKKTETYGISYKGSYQTINQCQIINQNVKEQKETTDRELGNWKLIKWTWENRNRWERGKISTS